jgi:TerC family integral membrane protein
VPTHAPEVWLGFGGLVVALLVLDLGVLNRQSHVLSQREALSWTAGIVGVAALFGVWLAVQEGHQAALEYTTGYLLELSLSVDNLFIFLLIFQYFSVPPQLQPRVLKWGIFGAMFMRGVMIVAGAYLIRELTWIVYIFGGILVLTGIRMLMADGAKIHPQQNPLVRLARRLFPISADYQGQQFFMQTPGRWTATPLFLVLLVVEWSDLVFAIDSIPAVFAVTRDPFIVYSSNIFAILGLRALYFVLAGAMDRFRHLRPGVALILVFVGLKMAAGHWVHVPILASLGVIVLILLGAVLLSLLHRPAAGAPD